METTVELLTRVKATHNLPSNYALAKKIGVSHQSIGQNMAGKTFLDSKSCFVVAELLNLNPAYVVACTSIERAKKGNKVKDVEFWQQYA